MSADPSGQPTAQPLPTESRAVLELFALVRTAFSSERSLLSAMRTSVSLYSFGFSITKFFDYLGQRGGAAPFEGARWIGVVLIAAGIVSLFLAIAQHLVRIGEMTGLGMPRLSRFSVSLFGAAGMLLVGVVTAIAVTLKWA